MTESLNNQFYGVENGSASYYSSKVENNFPNFGWFRRFFVTEQEKSPLLSGKVYQLQEGGNKIKGQLEEIKQHLLRELDEDLLPLIKEVLDPLLREADKNERELSEEEAIVKYSSWKDSAAAWVQRVQIYSKKRDKEEIFEALAEHIVQKSFTRVDRDLQFILEYVEQHVSSMESTAYLKQARKAELHRDITVQLEKLNSLKVSPPSSSLQEIGKWKEILDTDRSEHLHAALQIIDSN